MQRLARRLDELTSRTITIFAKRFGEDKLRGFLTSLDTVLKLTFIVGVLPVIFWLSLETTTLLTAFTALIRPPVSQFAVFVVGTLLLGTVLFTAKLTFALMPKLTGKLDKDGELDKKYFYLAEEKEVSLASSYFSIISRFPVLGHFYILFRYPAVSAWLREHVNLITLVEKFSYHLTKNLGSMVSKSGDANAELSWIQYLAAIKTIKSDGERLFLTETIFNIVFREIDKTLEGNDPNSDAKIKYLANLLDELLKLEVFSVHRAINDHIKDAESSLLTILVRVAGERIATFRPAIEFLVARKGLKLLDNTALINLEQDYMNTPSDAHAAGHKIVKLELIPILVRAGLPKDGDDLDNFARPFGLHLKAWSLLSRKNLINSRSYSLNDPKVIAVFQELNDMYVAALDSYAARTSSSPGQPSDENSKAVEVIRIYKTLVQDLSFPVLTQEVIDTGVLQLDDVFQGILLGKTKESVDGKKVTNSNDGIATTAAAGGAGSGVGVAPQHEVSTTEASASTTAAAGGAGSGVGVDPQHVDSTPAAGAGGPKQVVVADDKKSAANKEDKVMSKLQDWLLLPGLKDVITASEKTLVESFVYKLREKLDACQEATPGTLDVRELVGFFKLDEATTQNKRLMQDLLLNVILFLQIEKINEPQAVYLNGLLLALRASSHIGLAKVKNYTTNVESNFLDFLITAIANAQVKSVLIQFTSIIKYLVNLGYKVEATGGDLDKLQAFWLHLNSKYVYSGKSDAEREQEKATIIELVGLLARAGINPPAEDVIKSAFTHKDGLQEVFRELNAGAGSASQSATSVVLPASGSVTVVTDGGSAEVATASTTSVAPLAARSSVTVVAADADARAAAAILTSTSSTAPGGAGSSVGAEVLRVGIRALVENYRRGEEDRGEAASSQSSSARYSRRRSRRHSRRRGKD